METLEQFVSEQRIAHAERTAPQTTYAPVTGWPRKQTGKARHPLQFPLQWQKEKPPCGGYLIAKIGGAGRDRTDA